MTSPSSADQLDDSPTSQLSAYHPGVNELFAVLAYGEIAAFYRLTDEARMAPDLRGRISMASMAAAEMQHYERLRDALESRGVDVVSAMSRYVSTLDNSHRLTMPITWLEALVKTYVGDALAADLYREIADGLPDEVADVVREALSETGHSQFVVTEVRATVTGSSKQRSRLALWARRLFGEAITQAQYLLADHDELVDLVVSGTGGLGQLGAFFDRLQETHDRRMGELGLSGQPKADVLLTGAGRHDRVVGRSHHGLTRGIDDRAIEPSVDAGRDDRLGLDAWIQHDHLRPTQRHVELGLGVAAGVGVHDVHQVQELLCPGHAVDDGARVQRDRWRCDRGRRRGGGGYRRGRESR